VVAAVVAAVAGGVGRLREGCADGRGLGEEALRVLDGHGAGERLCVGEAGADTAEVCREGVGGDGLGGEARAIGPVRAVAVARQAAAVTVVARERVGVTRGAGVETCDVGEGRAGPSARDGCADDGLVGEALRYALDA
jgi:hypothetical protein